MAPRTSGLGSPGSPDALAAFYERSEPWWRAYEREPDLVQAWSGGVDQYYAHIDELMRAALGDLAPMSGRWPSSRRSSGRRPSSRCAAAACHPTTRWPSPSSSRCPGSSGGVYELAGRS